MANRATRRAAAKEPRDLALQITVDGRTYTLRHDEFNGEDDLLLFQKTGLTITDVFAGGRITLFSMAGLVWLHRRRHEPALQFEEVNRAMDFKAIETIEGVDGSEVGGPEA